MKRGRRNTGLLRLALLVLAGRRFWLLPFLPLLWLLFQAGVLIIGAEEGFTPASAQVALVGLPLTLLAVFLGLRIIAGEIDGRSLEIAYTVPGGCERVWWAKLLASTLVLLASETLLVAGTYIFFTPMPWSALYGALQPALFYLVLAMGMATLFRSEVAGAMGVAAILGLDLLISGFGTNPVRISPFWNAAVAIDNADDAAQLVAWSLQNHIGVLLAMAAILGLAFMRANRRERMLGA